MAKQKREETSTALQPAVEDSYTLAQEKPFLLASGGSLRPRPICDLDWKKSP